MQMTVKNLKPRNPVAVAARQRRAGLHRCSESSRRQAEARDLRALIAARRSP